MTEGNSDLAIRTDAGPDELLALLDWFVHDDVLRGRVHPLVGTADAGQMSNGIYEALGVALGSGGIASALSISLRTWLTHRHSDLKLTLTRSDGAHLEIDAARVDSVQVMRELRDLLELPADQS
ncbi:effector-associated constant component EACC1 [Nocardia stercoris]|uniref:Uncharacterized protein n=1 Tax=Nocardia stercoris TaxID=2483361 RepID=A0A3M2L9S6_9NOCA|nr:hypothetical protein [Nocardia stercoris]RMI32675.1 hypothetical protein EBN03_11960 [Nocardia stercoris]